LGLFNYSNLSKVFSLLKNFSDNSQKIKFPSGRPSTKTPPKSGGWYRFRNNESGGYDYVGKSNNLFRRYKEHLRKGKLNKKTHTFEYKETKNVPYNYIGKKEIEKIKKYFSSWNKNTGGGGRLPK